VGFSSPRNIGESLPWLQWIVDHYDTLPDVVVFLHGDQTAWHHAEPFDVNFLQTYTPSNVTMLSDKNCVWKADLPSRLQEEMPGLDLIYGAFWSLTFEQAFARFHMANNFICCSESMVTRQAIQRFGKPVYQQLVETMSKHGHWPWGWIMERSWQNLWGAPDPLPDRQIIQHLKQSRSANSFMVLHRSVDTPKHASSVQAVVEASAHCIDPHQHSSYLYSAEILANTYAGDPEIVPVLTELFNQLSGIGLQCLINSESKLEEITELVEDFFGMFERYLRFAPTIVLHAPTLLPTLRLWSVVIFVQQKEAVEAVIAFIESVFSHIAETKKVGRRYMDEHKASIGQMLQPHALQVAPVFVEAVFKLIAGVPTNYVQDSIPSILENIRSAFPQEFATWLEAGLGHLPPSVGSKVELQKFGEQILRGDDTQVYEAIQ
ncbi:Tnpo3, partial [Symbiodinium natans]